MPKKDANKKSSRKNDKKKDLKKVPRTVQQTIPYDSVYQNGIIKVAPGKFSRTYRLQDANFEIAEGQAQDNMFLDYEGLLNSIDVNMTAQITVYNRSVSQEVVKNRILLKPKGDQMNEYRDDYNSVLIDKMNEGRNNLTKDKYYTVTVDAASIEEADTAFRRIDADINSKVARINKKETFPLSLEERLDVLYDVFHEDTEFPFSLKVSNLMKGGVFDLKSLNSAGLTTKDLIGPDGFSFHNDYFTMGSLYGRSFFLDSLPTIMNTNILTDLSNLPCNMIASVYFRPIPTDKAALMVRHQITNINENIVRAQKKAARGNYSADIMPSELKRAQEEAESLRSDMQSRNQKLFYVSILVTLFAGSKEELEQYSQSLKSVGISHILQVRTLFYMQEAGFTSSLPLGNLTLGNMKEGIDRVLNTEASAVYMPFSVEELSQENGIYYGINAVSKNLILYDRMTGDSYNGLITGKSGSGKSFIAKAEMAACYLGTDDYIYVVDPQGEYAEMAKAFGGNVVRIAIGSDTHVNPLDMDVQYAGDTDDPVALKCDFLTAICETIIGQGDLDPIMVNTIHKAGKRIYQPYYEHMRTMVNHRDKNGNRITCDRQAMPTLVDFYQELRSQNDSYAQMLASAIEMYCVGNYDIFAKQTNIDPDCRICVYDIKDLPAGMKKLGLQIATNDIWNRVIENNKKKKITRFYMDEFHVLLQSKSSAQFIQHIYRTARKWGGVPTGITQNIEYILSTEETRVILSNCSFVIMLNQSPLDRTALAELFSISESLQAYITDKPSGTGLIYNGHTTVPFINQWPKDSMLYKMMSTKVTENFDDMKAGERS